jgi:hypothetical protein
VTLRFELIAVHPAARNYLGPAPLVFMMHAAQCPLQNMAERQQLIRAQVNASTNLFLQIAIRAMWKRV